MSGAYGALRGRSHRGRLARAGVPAFRRASPPSFDAAAARPRPYRRVRRTPSKYPLTPRGGPAPPRHPLLSDAPLRPVTAPPRLRATPRPHIPRRETRVPASLSPTRHRRRAVAPGRAGRGDPPLGPRRGRRRPARAPGRAHGRARGGPGPRRPAPYSPAAPTPHTRLTSAGDRRPTPCPGGGRGAGAAPAPARPSRYAGSIMRSATVSSPAATR
jgi:hypothetical protein